MKAVIVTLYKGSKPFSDELAHHLLQKGVDVELFDMFDMFTIKFADSNSLHYHVNNELIKKICNVRYVGTIFRFIFYKWYFIKNPLKCDHVSIHYALPFYKFFIGAFKRYTNSVSICIWGSDFYRISDSKRIAMNPLFDGCDSIIIGNLKMAEEFSSFYKQKYKQKILPVGFGIGKLDVIKSIKSYSDKKTIKNDLNIPDNKLVITIGYNGIRPQQHLLILDHFDKIPEKIKEDLFIIIPFGYGGDNDYKKLIESKLKQLSIKHIIYSSFISDEDVAKIRISTDLVINAQISDASSASIQEHLYAGNVLLAGEWLPYEYFTDKGVKLWSFKYDDFFEKLMEVLENFEKYEQEAKLNDEIIYNLSSWEMRINQWVDAFKTKMQ